MRELVGVDGDADARPGRDGELAVDGVCLTSIVEDENGTAAETGRFVEASRARLSDLTTVFGSATDVTLAELTLECFYPADEATRAATISPPRTGPSSRTMPMATMAGTTSPRSSDSVEV